MREKRFVVQEDANTDKIILLIDYKRMKMYSFLAEERGAVNKICNYLNWFDECTDNYVVRLKEIEESNCEKSKEIAKLKKENEQLQHELQMQKKWQIEKDTYYVQLKEENEQLEQKIKDKNEYQRVLEAKIRRLKDRIKVLEKNE